MFLALVFLIILIVALLGNVWTDARVIRISGWASWILFAIIFYVLFFKELNK